MATNRCCQSCVYATRPKGRWIRIILWRWPGLLLCCNCADAPGDLQEVYAGSTCRNFRPRLEPPFRHEPRQPQNGEFRRIGLTKGKFAIVDTADYERLNRYKWSAVRRNGNFYACRREGKRIIWMHREIMKPPKGMVVDHIDGNGLNNRRTNLRLCTPQQNGYNVKRPSTDSQYMGVLRCGLLWGARLFHHGQEHWLGLHDTEIEAAIARDLKAIELQGEYAYLNFPQGPAAARQRPRIVSISGSIIAFSRFAGLLSLANRTKGKGR